MLRKPTTRLKPDPPISYEKIKVVVVGQEKIGKTQFLSSYCNKKFSEEYDKTIGSDFFTWQGKFGAGSSAKNVSLSFWDMAGDQAYLEVRNEFYKDAQILFMCFDITNNKSFDNMEMWMREVSKHGGE